MNVKIGEIADIEEKWNFVRDYVKSAYKIVFKQRPPDEDIKRLYAEFLKFNKYVRGLKDENRLF